MMTAQCEGLTPATLKQGKSELGACLTLVSPSGLTADDRKEWLAVAMQTLSGIPADLLAYGCARARERCRFPSEIVPTIIETVGKTWHRRKEDARRAQEALSQSDAEPDPEYVDPSEVTKLIQHLSGRMEA